MPWPFDDPRKLPEDPLELLRRLLSHAYAIKTLSPVEFNIKRRSVAAQRGDFLRQFRDDLRRATPQLRAIWNAHRMESLGEREWDDDWMPTFVNVDTWAMSEDREKYRQKSVAFLELLQSRVRMRTIEGTKSEGAREPRVSLQAYDPRASASGVELPAKLGPREEGEWGDLPETQRSILEVLGNETLLGKQIAQKIHPEWTHDSIGKHLTKLQRLGILEKAGTRKGYRIVRLPAGAPSSLRERVGAST